MRWLAVAGALLTACTAGVGPPATSAASIGSVAAGSLVSATATTTARSSPGAASAPSPSSPAAAGSALRALAGLPVKGRAPLTGYRRAEFGDAWTDDVPVDGGHNGCDTRNDVLRRDLTDVLVKTGTHGCVASTGVLHDPYTGTTISFRRGAETSDLVQIDHVVALADAWQTGAQLLAAPVRRELANDPLELLAVDGRANQSKGSADAASWLPPAVAYRCAYVARQVAVKARYGLWVTPSERTAIATVLARCPQQELPTTDGTDVPLLVR